MILIFFVFSITLHLTIAKCHKPTPAQPTCSSKNFTTEPIDAKQVVALGPYFTVSLPSTTAQDNLIVQCFSYIELESGLFMYFNTNTYKNGSVTVDLFFLVDGPLGKGSYWFVGVKRTPTYTPLALTGYVVKEVCPDSCSSLFSAIQGSAHIDCVDLPSPAFPGFVFGTTTRPAECCLRDAEKHVKDVVGDITLVNTSKNDRGKTTCVADFFGVPVIKLDTLKINEDVKLISYPSMKPHKS